MNDRTTFGQHASFASARNFLSTASTPGTDSRITCSATPRAAGRNFPLQTFGMKHSPYSALYIQDAWKPTSRLTVNLGLRYDRWHERRAVRGNVTSFEPSIGKAIAGEDTNGQVDLTAQPVAQFVAAATQGLWVRHRRSARLPGCSKANGFFSPRLASPGAPPAKTIS